MLNNTLTICGPLSLVTNYQLPSLAYLICLHSKFPFFIIFHLLNQLSKVNKEQVAKAIYFKQQTINTKKISNYSAVKKTEKQSSPF
jgi:hypothetical protein